ncbi:MAG: hypothetical protein JNM51_13860 [Bacteroidia bacterium]|nr:hypothetical protein [Bacteroidia bacterium]
MKQTFTDFKKDFYSRVDDLSLFDCDEINLLKVVLDGLKVNYVNRGKVNAFLFLPTPVYKLFLIAKNKSSNQKQIRAIKKEATKIIIDNGRFLKDENGKIKSLYFDNIKSLFKVSDYLYIKENNTELIADFSLMEIISYYTYEQPSDEEERLRKQIIETFKKIRDASIFSSSELGNIKFAFHKFFQEYKVWSRFLKEYPYLKQSLFTCHYHREGQILAFKRRGVKCVEFQHGLIAEQDVFYMFPKQVAPIKSKCLFADQIMVYGKYWKDQLLEGVEYSEDQINVIGYYHADMNMTFPEEIAHLKSSVQNKRFILITTQTFLHKHFVKFAIELSEYAAKNESSFVIVLKSHPAEDVSIYQNALNSYSNIKVISSPLPVLLSHAFSHISIYSTTLFDALRFKVSNFVFKIPECEDYVNNILRAEVATELKSFSELFASNDNKSIDPTYFYENFHSNLISN